MSSSEGSVRNCEAGINIFDAETLMQTSLGGTFDCRATGGTPAGDGKILAG